MAKIRTKLLPGFIETDNDIRMGVKALRRKCPAMRRAHDAAGDPPLRRQTGGFQGLVRIIVAQQLSTASAGAIWTRLAATIEPMSAAALLAASEPRLRAAGLSGPKVKTLRAVSAAVVEGLDLEALSHATDDEVHAALTAVKGIGPWTADIYIMFCLGRADAFAVGDLALQIAAQHAAGLETRPSPADLLDLAERWRPWRGVAARLLWAYYPHIRKTGTPSATSEPV